MRLCSVENCGMKHRTNGFCDKHNKQVRKYGSVLERTKNDPNEFIIENDICRIKLYNTNCEEITETIFDLKYKEEIEKYKWRMSNKYVVSTWIDTNNKKHNMYLHQAIIQLSGQEVPIGYEIDHIDRNPLNNLENNLRVCTISQNRQNVDIKCNNSSGYKGIVWHKKDKKWYARIRINNQIINIGIFNTPEDAAKAYDVAAIKYHGEFAVLNTQLKKNHIKTN